MAFMQVTFEMSQEMHLPLTLLESEIEIIRSEFLSPCPNFRTPSVINDPYLHCLLESKDGKSASLPSIPDIEQIFDDKRSEVRTLNRITS